MTGSACRFCGSPLEQTFADLGMSPLSNAYVGPEQANRMEPFFPLHAFVCSDCKLVQLEEFETPKNIFNDYAYFSSFSTSWLDHCKRYAYDMAQRFELNGSSQVVEVASNDGYLLQFFKEQEIPVLGIEPAANVAEAARKKGIDTEVAFFGAAKAAELSAKGRSADLIAANNVMAHVPDLNDFVAGFKALLKPDGIVTVEFPHLLRLIEDNQFDTIYHEHFSYFSLFVADQVFARHGLTVVDVDELPTHGGSLRIYGKHQERGVTPGAAVARVLEEERAKGVMDLATYAAFSNQVVETKLALLRFLLDARDKGRSVVGYGAPAKGNTLLNYCGIKPDLLSATVDISPHKQNQLLPGTRIPIHHPDWINEKRPDYLLILPWNLKDEIMQQMAHIREWGGKFVVPIPTTTILD